MNEQTKRQLQNRLQNSLTDLISEWLERDDIDLPLVGDGVAIYMADAALAVLVGIADTQAYLAGEGMLVDED